MGMTFSGKELFELGVPKNKIKYFIGKDFTSKDEILQILNSKPAITKADESILTVKRWVLDTFDYLPMVMKGNLPIKMSNSELSRILDSGGLVINNQTPKSDAPIAPLFPISSMVWFPKSSHKITWH